MFEVKQTRQGNGTSLFEIYKDGKRIEFFVADEKSDKEVEKWQKQLNRKKK